MATKRTSKGVYKYRKGGKTYWAIRYKDPVTDRWESRAVSKKLARALGVEPQGDSFTAAEARRVHDAFMAELESPSPVPVFFDGPELGPTMNSNIMEWRDAAKRYEQYNEAELEKEEGAPGSVNAEEKANDGRTSSKPSIPTLRETYDAFDGARCSDISPVLRDRKRRIFEDFIGLVGDIPIDQVEDTHVTRFRSELEQRGTSDGRKPLRGTTSLREYLSYVMQVFRYAQQKGLIRINPFDLIKLPPRARPGTSSFDAEEILAKVREFRDRPDGSGDYLAWLTVGVFMTGLSPIEWRSADWKNYESDERALLIKEVKPQAGRARKTWVPIPEVLFPAFEARRGSTGPVFPNRSGVAITKSAAASLLRRISSKWPGFTWTALRLSFSGFLHSKRCDPALVDRLLRHDGSSGLAVLQMLTDHYRPPDLRLMRETVDEHFATLEELAALAMPR